MEINEDNLKTIIFKLVRNIELSEEENNIVEDVVNEKLE